MNKLDIAKNIQFVFLFILDAVRKDHLSLYGYKRKTTPNIDRLAKQATVYNWAFSPAPYTLASVPSILTGKYPVELSNMFTGFEFTERDFENFGKLKQKGYKTAMFTANIVTSHYQTNLYKFFDYFWDNLSQKELNREDMLYEKAEVVLEAVKKFIKKNKEDKLFVVIHLMEAHGPYVPEVESKFKGDELYKKDKRKITRVVNDSFTGVSYELLKKEKVAPKYQLLDLVEGPNGEIEDFNRNVADYIAKYDMGIYLLDKNVGEFIDFLKKEGLFDPSEIIFTSDHGELLGEENVFFSHGIDTRPELINVPLIIKNSYQSTEKLVNRNFSLTFLLPMLISKREFKKNIVFSYHTKSVSIINDNEINLVHLGELDVIDSKKNHLFPTNAQEDIISVLNQINFFQWKKLKNRLKLEIRKINTSEIDRQILKKVNQSQKKSFKKLEFTGERMIPELNKGAAFFYEHLARYLFSSQFVKEKIALDAGCGAGYGSHILATYGKAKKVYAVDISKEAIEYAQSKYSQPNIKFQIDDVEKLTKVKNNSIDIIVSFEVIEHLKNQEKFLDQVKRILKKDGLFIVSTPNKYTYPAGNPFHTKELYPEEFYQLLKKYFKNVKFYHQGFELAQLIKPEKEKNFILEENFFNLKQNLFTHPVDNKKSQYIIALCSDDNLPKPELVSISSTKVDNFDLSQGLLSLGKQFGNLYNQIKNLNEQNQSLQTQLQQTQTHIQNLENTLNMIKSAKFFKLWQFYCKIRDKILSSFLFYDKKRKNK